MKQQEQSSGIMRRTAPWTREAREACRALGRLWRGQPCLVQGSVNDIAPKTPGARVTYTWTRKVRAKTVTVALSKEQAEAFRRAIAVNRDVESALAKLRAASQAAILSHLPDAPKRRSFRSKRAEQPSVPNALK